MLLTLFITFLILTFILIGLGLGFIEHSEMAIIGFMFLFILSMSLIVGDIQYKTGVNYTYSCICCEDGRVGSGELQQCSNGSNLYIIQTIDNYAVFEPGGIMSYTVGYYLAVMSIIGFIAVMLNFRRAV